MTVPSFHCPVCKAAYRMREDLAGRRVKCQACGSVFKIAATQVASAVRSASAPMALPPGSPAGANRPGQASASCSVGEDQEAAAREEASKQIAAETTRTETSAAGRHGGTATESWSPAAGADAAAEAVPAQIDRYRIVRQLGAGSFGTVWLGHHDQLDRSVAIKVPRAGHPCGAEDFLNFLDEARTLARLRHPGIVSVYDAGRVPDGRAFVVMEYVHGQSLGDRLKQGRAPPEESARLVAAMAEAVQFAHQNGFVHRDLKPSNILLDERGEPRVADFGLALDEGSQLQRAGEVAGTLSYMSPEQIRGQCERLDGRSDLWSLGVILYELLTGQRPFVGTRQQVREGILARDPRPLRQRDGGIPAELERICLKCLEKDPERRYTSAADLAADLRRWQRRGGRRALRAAILIGGAVAALSAAVVASTMVLAGFHRPKDAGAHELASRDVRKQSAELEALRNALPKQSAELQALRNEMPKQRAELQALRDELERLRDQRRKGLGQRLPEPRSAPAAGAGRPTTGFRLPGALAALDRAIREARAAGDEKKEYDLLLQATNALVDAGHFDTAEAAARRMVELSAGDPARRPFAVMQLGLAQYRGGKALEALPNLEDAARAFSTIYAQLQRLPPSKQSQFGLSHTARLVGIALTRVGNANKAIGNFQKARTAYEEGLQVLRRHDRKRELITLLLDYGGMESERGNHRAAFSLLGEGLYLAKAIGDNTSQAELLINLGNAKSRSGDREAALADYQAASTLLPATAPYESRTSLLLNWTVALAQAQRWPEALKRLEELRRIARADDARYRRLFALFDGLSASRSRPGAAAPSAQDKEMPRD